MSVCKRCALALFVVLSVALLFLTPGAADDLEGVSQRAHAPLVILENIEGARQPRSAVSRWTAQRARQSLAAENPRSAPLLDLVCVLLC
jgi:hypothetical protein